MSKESSMREANLYSTRIIKAYCGEQFYQTNIDQLKNWNEDNLNDSVIILSSYPGDGKVYDPVLDIWRDPIG